jgi:hypothetical protein
MAATANSALYLTLADWAKRQAPGGGIDQIVEVLTTTNPIIEDAHIQEGNLPTGDQITRRTSLPTGTWRLLNYGVAPGKSTTEQFTETCGILEDYSKLDVDIASLNANAAAFRASEDNAFVSSFNNTIATAIFYANSAVNPEQMLGFDKRYASLSGSTADYIVNCSGSSALTSVWFVTWGPQTCYLIYPKGSQAGLVAEDLGKQLVTDSNGLMFQAYVTKFQWKLGMALKDYRRVVRICNIDTSTLTSDAATGTDLLDKMVDAFYRRPTANLGDMARTYVYCNPTIAKYLHKQAMNKSNVNLTIDNVAGKPIVNFLGAPIRICDAITSAETAVA